MSITMMIESKDKVREAFQMMRTLIAMMHFSLTIMI